jgi:hypothetical protein
LYAYIERVPFYERLGFRSDSEFIFLRGKGFSPPSLAGAVPIDRENLSSIVALDKKCFGASREKLLKPILLDKSSLCYMITEGKGVLGYVAATTYGRAAELGPLVCPRNHSDVALDLLKTVLAKLKGSDVSLCASTKDTSICDMLWDGGFETDFRLMRMFRGKRLTKDCIYLAESLERG